MRKSDLKKYEKLLLKKKNELLENMGDIMKDRVGTTTKENANWPSCLHPRPGDLSTMLTRLCAALTTEATANASSANAR